MKRTFKTDSKRSFVVCDSTRHVVDFRIADHETEIRFRSKVFFIQHSVNLVNGIQRVHRDNSQSGRVKVGIAYEHEFY